jgi:hypothetical protein
MPSNDEQAAIGIADPLVCLFPMPLDGYPPVHREKANSYQ